MVITFDNIGKSLNPFFLSVTKEERNRGKPACCLTSHTKNETPSNRKGKPLHDKHLTFVETITVRYQLGKNMNHCIEGEWKNTADQVKPEHGTL